jgi:hypothetical protein
LRTRARRAACLRDVLARAILDTKLLGARALASDVVWKEVEGEGFVAEAMPRTPVKGREAPVELYKLA